MLLISSESLYHLSKETKMKRKRKSFVKVFKKLSWFLLISGLGLILACRSWSQIQVPGLGHDRYGTYRPVRLVLVQY